MSKFFLWAIIPLGFALAGCATCDPSRIDSLDARVKALETKIQASEPAAQTITAASSTGEAASEAVTTVAPPENPGKSDIQACLKNAGYYDGQVDGKLGPKTKKAIEAFQTANELVADGKVGPNTWNKLKKFYTGPSETTEPTESKSANQ